MAYRRTALAVGEWFHCYSKTVDGSRPFENANHARRFLETLFLANQPVAMPIMPHLYQKFSHDEIFAIERKTPLVAIGAYCIMPTHYHLLIQPVVENGLSDFMHKVGTGFTRYYNDRHERVGNLFVKPFRSKHIGTDGYLGRVSSYIHLNPTELFEPNWKQGRLRNRSTIQKRLLGYDLSSFLDYQRVQRPQKSILDDSAMETVRSHLTPIGEAIDDAVEYYRSLEL